MYVILDSNQIMQDYRLEGPHFKALRVFLNTQGATLVVPRIVVDEVVAHLRRDLKDKWGKVEAFARYWRRFDTDPPIKPSDLRGSIEAAVNKYQEYLLDLLSRATAEVPALPDIDVGNVVSRILARKKPIGAKGEGVIDYLLWRIAVEYSQQKGDVHFITANSKDFGKSDKGLPAEMDADLADAHHKLKLWSSLSEFLQSNAVTDEQFDIEWLKQQPAFLEMRQTAELATAAFQKLANAYLEGYDDRATGVTVDSIKTQDWLAWDKSTDFMAEVLIPLAIQCTCFVEPRRHSGRDAKLRTDLVDMYVEVFGAFELSGKTLKFKHLFSGTIKDFEGYEQPENPPVLIGDIVFDVTDADVMRELRRRAGQDDP